MATEQLTMTKRPDVSVKLGYEAYRKAKTVAGWRDIGLNEYLTEIVEAAADKDLDQMARDRSRRRKGQEEGE